MEAHATRADAWADRNTAPPPAVPLSAVAVAGHGRGAQSSPRATGNALLDALGEGEWTCLEPLLRPVTFTTKQALFEPHQNIDAVYFPVRGVISLVAVTEDGASSVHVASVGVEGVAGIPVYFGAGSSANLRAVAQMPGIALTLPASPFGHQLDRSAQLRRLIGNHAHALLTQAAQEVACNRRHSVLERCSCWLLVTADRARSEEFPMTQEFLAELLGTRRASVVAAARVLHAAGAISYRRGRIAIADRGRLEAFACGCYRVIRQSLFTAG